MVPNFKKYKFKNLDGFSTHIEIFMVFYVDTKFSLILYPPILEILSKLSNSC